MKAKEFITERNYTAPLYHGTTWYKAYQIMKSGHFVLSDARHNKYQKQLISDPKYPYYLSASRSKYSGFCNQEETYCNVMFVLDTEALQRNHYKTAPIHPDSIWFGMHKNPNDHELEMAEERIWGKTPNISTNFLKEIHAWVPDGKYSVIMGFDTIIDKANEINIPIYMYDNHDAYRLQNKNKAI